jgi:Ser/Thr protein kinase RdoA (MazF antagonist)
MAEQVLEQSVASPVAEITSYLRELGSSDDLLLTPLAEGCHNAVYLCENGPTDFPTKMVVRIPKCPEAARATEANIAYLEGLPAPQALHLGRLAVSGRSILLEEYVEGEEKGLDLLTSAEIDELAAKLASMHSRVSKYFSETSGCGPLRSGTCRDYLLAMVAETVTGKLHGIDTDPYPSVEQVISSGIERLRRITDAESTLYGSDTFSLLHHDLNPGNMLWQPDGSVIFIDWNITFGDPADDVDYVVTNNRASDAFRNAFFEAYAESTGNDDVIARVGAYTLKNQLDDLVWVMLMHQRFAEDQRFGSKAYEQRLLSLLTTLDSK